MPFFFAVFHVAGHFAVRMLFIFDVDEARSQELVRECADLAIVTNEVHEVDQRRLLRRSEKYMILKTSTKK